MDEQSIRLHLLLRAAPLSLHRCRIQRLQYVLSGANNAVTPGVAFFNMNARALRHARLLSPAGPSATLHMSTRPCLPFQYATCFLTLPLRSLSCSLHTLVCWHSTHSPAPSAYLPFNTRFKSILVLPLHVHALTLSAPSTGCPELLPLRCRFATSSALHVRHSQVQWVLPASLPCVLHESCSLILLRFHLYVTPALPFKLPPSGFPLHPHYTCQHVDHMCTTCSPVSYAMQHPPQGPSHGSPQVLTLV